MANRLKMAKVNAALMLHERGWSNRRIARTLGIDRKTVSEYVRAAAAKRTEAPIGSAIGEDDSKRTIAPTGSEPTVDGPSPTPAEPSSVAADSGSSDRPHADTPMAAGSAEPPSGSSAGGPRPAGASVPGIERSLKPSSRKVCPPSGSTKIW